MKYAVLTLLVMTGCAVKAPHKINNYRFIGIHADGTCEVDKNLTKWDASGVLVVTCKPEAKP